MVYLAVVWLNIFPSAKPVSGNMSPHTLITGEVIDFNKHCKLKYGSYVQTHESHDNSMQPQTVGSIALRPTWNSQGGWTEVPMPEKAISSIHQLACCNPLSRVIQDRSRSESLHNLSPEQLMNESDGNNDDSTFVLNEASLASKNDNTHYDDAISIRRDLDNFIPIEQDLHETNTPDAEDNIFEDNEESQDKSDDENDSSQEETDKTPNKEMAGVSTNNANIATIDEDTAGVVKNEDAVLQGDEENTLQAEINDKDIVVNIIPPEEEGEETIDSIPISIQF
eukprot:8974200-Ditylum_brightwellii.AAC.1